MTNATMPSATPEKDTPPEAVERRGAFGFPLHAGRAAALGEIHSRPAPSIAAPRALVKLCFMTEGGATVDHAVLSELSRRHGAAPPVKQARHHTIRTGKGTLQWERHTEASTYLWEGHAAGKLRSAADRPSLRGGVSGSRHADRRRAHGNPQALRRHDGPDREFDPVTLCCSVVEGGLATIVTDFRQDASGLTQILVLDNGHEPAAHGSVGATPVRHRDLPDARHARPAARPVPVAAHAQGRGPAGLADRSHACGRGRRCGTLARRDHRACGRPGGRCGVEPLPLRRKPRL
jgi:hypothetical protein